MLDENKWLAARHGLDAELVDLPERRQGLGEGADPATPGAAAAAAQDLGSERELEGIEDLLRRGTGSTRQKLVYEANHDFGEVMREIVRATGEGL